MDEATARFLISDEGRDLLRRVAEMPGDKPARVLALRKRVPDPAVAAAAVEVAEARHRARRRFADAASLFFTDEALAQATSPGIATYHASRLAPYGHVADLCCGIGMDAVALAEAGATVTAIELDPARLVFARANAEARGVADRITFVEGDVTALDWSAPAAFFDPARRGDAGRVSRHADRYAPPLTFLHEVAGRTCAACAKLSPALPDDVLADLGGVVEFLSEGRECKEACVWLGEEAREEARGEAPPAPNNGGARGGGLRDGGALPGIHSPHYWGAGGASAGASTRPSSCALLLPERIALPTSEGPPAAAPRPGAFLLDPDPAAVRAHALPALCARAGGNAALVSPDDAYLTADAPPAEPRLASAYRVIESLPYHPKTVGALLRSRGAGRLVLKKRHFPKEPDAVAKELGLNGRGDEATLVLVRDVRGFLAVLCEPL